MIQPKIWWTTKLSKKSESHLDDVVMFPFSNAIFLRGIGESETMKNLMLDKKIFKLQGSIFTSIFHLKFFNTSGEFFFPTRSLNLKKKKKLNTSLLLIRGYKLGEPTKIINENKIKPTSTHGGDRGFPNMGVDEF